jgi:Tat protein translocase TatB subunit
MNFLGIGTWEILLILFVAFLVVGPQRLPEVAVSLARAIRWLRRYASQVIGPVRREFDDLVRGYEDLRKEVTELRQQVDREATTTARQVGETVQETRKAMPGGPLLETSAEPLPIDKPGQSSASEATQESHIDQPSDPHPEDKAAGPPTRP